ncbi:MAG: hypothetical protein K9H26_18390 [Prolixibacteraceae bacterium]|nr:hypothetical protein [Prolixibacteraceae bacterium]
MIKAKNHNDIDVYKKNLVNKGSDFQIFEKSAQKSIIVNGKHIVTTQTKDKKLQAYFKLGKKSSLINTIHKNVYKKTSEKGFAMQDIKPEYPPENRNRKAFAEIETDQKLVYIDINHAYWRVAFILGYIDKSLYEKYAYDQEYKLARNIGLSTMVSQKKKHYYFNGKYARTIVCENSMYEKMYKNIRYTTYNIIGELAELIGDGCLAYKVDGLLILNDNELIKFCKEYLKGKNVTFEIKRYKKLNEKELLSVKENKIKKY